MTMDQVLDSYYDPSSSTHGHYTKEEIILKYQEYRRHHASILDAYTPRKDADDATQRVGSMAAPRSFQVPAEASVSLALSANSAMIHAILDHVTHSHRYNNAPKSYRIVLIGDAVFDVEAYGKALCEKFNIVHGRVCMYWIDGCVASHGCPLCLC